ncbi:hypothetical protein P167DRAFT_532709 [Morchella conica CCBAS932]|uniref:Uncharacterized protein n=1 Tax=Morchella conica CCBAS932 TaxID=1392247 RepID=A0A3N4LCP4_9PEZI|nr:hypothetical protein P167DRAFT_532709 [Morchella conica CCBAS932]
MPCPTEIFPRVVMSSQSATCLGGQSFIRSRFQAWDSNASSLKGRVHESRLDGLRGGVWLR